MKLTPDQYRTEIAALNLSQRAAARVIGIDERTSRRYALKGVPDSSDERVLAKLSQFKTNNTTPEGERE